MMTSQQQSIDAFIQSQTNKDLLRLLACGHVDDGKSTLLGRLLYDTQSLYRDQIEALYKDSAKRSGPKVDFSLLLDGLLQEREQGITIDVAYRFFSTSKRSFIVQDAPGHIEYTRNMITAASTADLALLLVDATQGLCEQTKRHAFIASLFGVRHFIVAINKMDAIDYDRSIYDNIVKAFSDYAVKLELASLHFVPVSALRGDNVTLQSPHMPWYQGATLLSLLEDIHIEIDRNLIDLRLPIQSAVRTSEFRGYMGTLASGSIRKGEIVYSLPAKQQSKVRSIFSAGTHVDEAFAGEALMIQLEDDIDLSRGDMIVRKNNQPRMSERLEVMAIGLNDQPLEPNRSYFLKLCHQEMRCSIESIHYIISVESLHREHAESIQQNQIARIVLRTAHQCIYDAYIKNRITGAGILIDPESDQTSAALMVIDRDSHDHAFESKSLDDEVISKNNINSSIQVPRWIICTHDQLVQMRNDQSINNAILLDNDEVGNHFRSDDDLIWIARLCKSSNLSCICALSCSDHAIELIQTIINVESLNH